MPKSDTDSADLDGLDPASPEASVWDRSLAVLERAGLFLASGALLALTVLMVVEATQRYLFGAPIGWSYELIQSYLLPGILFLALASTYRSGAHVAVDVLYNRCGPRAQSVMFRVGLALMLAWSCLLIWASWIATSDAWSDHDIPPPGGSALSIPTWTWHILVPVGVTLLAVRFAVDLLTNRRGSDSTEGLL